MKPDDLDPDVAKFVHELCGGVYAQYAQKEAGKEAKE